MRDKAFLQGAALAVMLAIGIGLADPAFGQQGQDGRGGDTGSGPGDSNTTWTTSSQGQRTPQLRRIPQRVICPQLPCRLPDGRVLLGPAVDAGPVVMPGDRAPRAKPANSASSGKKVVRDASVRKKPAVSRGERSVAEILAALPASRIPVPQPRPDGIGPSLPEITQVPDPRPALPGLPPRLVTGEFVPDEVLVTLDGNVAVAADIASAFNLEVRSARSSTLLGATVARLGIPDGRAVGLVLAQLATDSRVTQSDANHIYTLQGSHTPAQYMFQRIAFDAGVANGQGVKVAVIDTAVDTSHPALRGVIADSFDAMPDRPVVKTDHGTSIVGLVAGVGPLKGMAPGSAVYHARAFENDRSNMGILLDALDWAADSEVRIINMSFAGPRNDLFEAACRSARARGIVLVAAAGNNGPDAPFSYPGAYEGVVAVTATDKDDALMPEANRGPYVYVSAPGVDVIAPVTGGADFVTGTSIAAAVVSGAIANLLREDPKRSPEWIDNALAATARDLGPAGRDTDFGYGLLDMKAVSLTAAQ